MGRTSPRQITCCCCSPSSLPPPRLPSGWSTPSSPRTASCPTRCKTHLVVTCLHRADSSPPPRPAPWTRAPSAGQAGQLRARRREPRGLTSSPPMPPSIPSTWWRWHRREQGVQDLRAGHLHHCRLRCCQTGHGDVPVLHDQRVPCVRYQHLVHCQGNSDRQDGGVRDVHCRVQRRRHFDRMHQCCHVIVCSLYVFFKENLTSNINVPS